MGGAFGFVPPVIPENSSRGVRREKCYPLVSRFVRVFNKNFTRNCREFFPQTHIKSKSDINRTYFCFFGYQCLTFYVMFILLNAAIAIKNKIAVIEIPHIAVIKTPLTVKDVKGCFNRELSGKIPFAKFAVLPTVDYCFLKTSFIIFVSFGGVP